MKFQLLSLFALVACLVEAAPTPLQVLNAPPSFLSLLLTAAIDFA
jgi:hypothetical protein